MRFLNQGSIYKRLVIGFVLVAVVRQLVHWTNEYIVKSKIASITADIFSADWADIRKIMGTDTLPMALNIDYIIENRTMCSVTGELLLVVIVHTAPKNFDKRKTVRQTWMHPKYVTRYGMTRLLFVLGKTDDKDLQTNIEKESGLHGDILQGNFHDSYYNITNKAVMAYKWLTDRCGNAKFVLKVDDDVMVNIFHLFHTVLPSLHDKTNSVVCVQDTVAEISRRKEDKWFVQPKYFPGRERYPDMCMGYFVLLTGDLISKMYEVAKVTPFFWIDDVYAYGILINRIPNVKRISARERKKWLRWFVVPELGTVRLHIPESCLHLLLLESRYCKNILAVGDLSVEEMVKYWNVVLRTSV